MKKKDSTRRLSAIMFTDIVGYTALMQQDEAKAAQIRQRHRQIFDQYHQQYNGDILQYFGDGTLSVFQSGVEAVECALAIQLALQEERARTFAHWAYILVILYLTVLKYMAME
jgi:adenylate cyclase